MRAMALACKLAPPTATTSILRGSSPSNAIANSTGHASEGCVASAATGRGGIGHGLPAVSPVV
jgi:hypothetical protein